MESKEIKDSILRCLPLFEKWSSDLNYELEARIFLISKEDAEAKKVPTGIPKNCFVSLLAEYEKAYGPVPVTHSTDYSIGRWRYTRTNPKAPSDTKEDKFTVMEKVLADRADFYIPEWGVGYRINLKRESPVKDAPPFRKERVTYSRTKSRQSWDVKGMMIDFTHVEDSNKIQTNEVELELQHQESASLDGFANQLLQLLEQLKRTKAA